MTAETIPGTIRIYCDRSDPFHSRHGRTWHETFERDDLDNWECIPVQHSRQTAPRDNEPRMGNARQPQHTAHIRGSQKPVGDQLYDFHAFADAERESVPDGNALQTLQLTYNWRCPCRNSLSVSSERLRRPLGELIDNGMDQISLDGLRYLLHP